MVVAPPLGLVEPAGPAVVGNDPQHRFPVAAPGQLGGHVAQQRSAEPTAPHLRVQVDGVQLADARSPTVVFGSGCGEPDDDPVINDHFEPLNGQQRQQLAAPVAGSVVNVELVEVHIGHHTSIRGLPGTHLDRPDPLGVPELGVTNRRRHHVHPAQSAGNVPSAFPPAFPG